MPRYKVAVIIPVFNQWVLTAGCLHSLREHTPREDVQVIVVDNGSADETAQACGPLGRELFGARFEHVRLEENINFGPGCNLGANRADADFLFFLNNDTLLTPGWLPPLLDAFTKKPRLGAVGPLLLYPGNDRVQHLGVTFTPNMHVDHLYHFFPASHRVVNCTRALQAITGAALMLQSEVFRQAGRFWEEYRNGYEDLDLCWQIRARGLTLHCEPASRVFHLTSQTVGRFDAENHNSQLLLRRCNQAFIPDLHRFAVQDGFSLRLSPTLRMTMMLVRDPQETIGLDMDGLWAEILAEPLWLEGYERLLELFVKRGLWDAALDLLRMQLSYFYDERIFLNLAKVATRLRNEQVLLTCRKSLENLKREAGAGDLNKKYASLRNWAEKAEDSILLGLCDEWAVRHMARA
jgi:GT2 family glycosyltransferase